MKRILSLIICLSIIICACPIVFAGPVISQELIRVWNKGAEISVILSGEPGADASVLVLNPSTTLPDATTELNVFTEGVDHIDSLTLDENGEYTFTYPAKNPGVYTVYVRDAEIKYSVTNNTPPVTNPDRFYVELWLDNSASSYTHPDLNYAVTLTKAQLTDLDIDTVAQNIWDSLKTQPNGRRSIFIHRTLSPYTNTPDRSDEVVWWDEGAEAVAELLDEFFLTFSKIPGATVDLLYGDMEHTHGIDSPDEAIDKVAAHPRFETEMLPELLARGYDQTLDNGTPLNSVKNESLPNKNGLIYGKVCTNMANKYFTQAIYEPARKYFANVKYSEYGSSASKIWSGGYSYARKSYLGGNTVQAGTHSSPDLYSGRYVNYNKRYAHVYGIPGENGSTIDVYSVPQTAGENFKELMGTVIACRATVNVTKDGAIIPWIATKPVLSETSFPNPEFRSEMIMHVALHNPDRLLHYVEAPKDETEPTIEKQSEDLMVVLDEVNGLVAYPDRRNLNIDRVDVSLPFVISGIYANGRNLWRITPDDALVGKFAPTTTANGVVFTTAAATVTFPEGTVINVEDTVSDVGYWIETPAGVNPVMDYVTENVEEEAIISFYDVERGQKADLETAEVVDAVASFKGYYGGKGLNFIAAKYDANGILIDFESKECGILAPYGDAAFIEIGKDLDTADIKFYLWEDETIRPLAAEEM